MKTRDDFISNSGEESISLKEQCVNLGFGMGPCFEMVPYCMKQHEEPTETHLHMHCGSCPDFELYEYNTETDHNLKV